MFCPLLTIWTSEPSFHSILEPKSRHLPLEAGARESTGQDAGGGGGADEYGDGGGGVADLGMLMEGRLLALRSFLETW